jgi:hypothetical protein
MNEQQLAAVKQALEALMVFRYAPPAQRPLVLKAIADLEQVIAQDALDKMAENARELGLSYDDAVKGGVGIMLGGKRIDPASIYAEPKIGCVNHDCDKCKAVQEPVAWMNPHGGFLSASYIDEFASGLDKEIHNIPLYTAPPAAQPVPVKTYHDGKPWPVAPKPWVGLTDEEIEDIHCIPPRERPRGEFPFARMIEAKLKEKNHG